MEETEWDEENLFEAAEDLEEIGVSLAVEELQDGSPGLMLLMQYPAHVDYVGLPEGTSYDVMRESVAEARLLLGQKLIKMGLDIIGGPDFEIPEVESE